MFDVYFCCNGYHSYPCIEIIGHGLNSDTAQSEISVQNIPQ
jgi:hypothetical protein